MMNKLVEFSPKQKKVINYPFDHTLDVFEGTPRSSKTTAGAFRMARFLATSKDQNHLIVAYNQEQAFRLMLDCDGMGLLHIFGHLAELKNDRFGDHLQVHTPNGIKNVYYKGGGKAHNHKAITGMSLGSVWFMEIDLLHMNMIQECFRRTFASINRYHFADLNPPSPNHPVIKEVFDVQKTRWTHWTIDDNPIITEERKQELYETLSKNPYLLERDWKGNRVMPQGVIYSMFDMNENQEEVLLGKPYEMFFTADGGQNDATSASCNIITRYKGKFRLNRVAHYYHSGAETGQAKAMSVYAKEIKQFINWAVAEYEMHYTDIFVDPACKSLREEMHLEGLDTSRADNNASDARMKGGGIEVGIERVQNSITNGQFFIVESKEEKYSHYNFLKEIGMYSRDGHGNPIDAYNDAMDEFRYSNNYFYKNYVI